MKCPPIAENEDQRLQALIAHGLGDEALVPNLDPVVRIAAQMFSTPVSAINMIGSDHVFFAASVGIGETDMRRDVSFCAHAIAQPDVMVVTDTRTDDRFHDNPLVTGPANVRFYAGVPLKSPDGHALGALCVIDNKPRPDFSDDDRQRLLELVGNADLALFQAKHEGRGRICVFAPTLKEEAMARRSYGMELHRAVDQGEFRLFYQPQVRLHDGALTGAEALLRWQHPQRGLLSPAAFLPAMEDGPLAATVGAWVLDEACAQAAYWRRHGAPDFRIGINLFGAQFRDGDLMAAVLDALHRHGLPPQAIELEITENIVLGHDERVLDVLQRLRELGVGIAFDDFGTGYASLSLLTSYPLSRIKIDRSFVRGMIDSRREAAVIRAILDMAYSLEIDTIAEGIETVSQRDLLQRARCDEGQGYLFARPLPPDQFEESYRLGLARQRAVA